MEKILFIVDPRGVDRSALNFACFLGEITNSRITAAFLAEPVFNRSAGLSTIIGDVYLEPVLENVEAVLEEQGRQIEEQRTVLRQVCSHHGASWAELPRPVKTIDEIVTESRFSDMIILSAETSFNKTSEAPPSDLVKQVLVRSECPVLIAPLQFEDVDEVLFAYDGSASSVFAIKQFTYLFPQLSDRKVSFLEVNEGDESKIKHHEKISEYLKTHYSAIGFQVLHGRASDELFGHLLGKKNVFVVMGAFGRNLLSGFFRKSTADLVLRTTNLPIFITHT